MTTLTKEYELFYFLPITFTPEEVSAVREKITALIAKHNGAVTKEEDLGKKKLTFTIKGARHGYYFLIHFTVATNQVAFIDREVKLMPEVIRHRLVIKEDYPLPRVSNLPYTNQEKTEDQPTAETVVTSDQEAETGEVDRQELDRKIDELLLEDI